MLSLLTASWPFAKVSPPQIVKLAARPWLSRMVLNLPIPRRSLASPLHSLHESLTCDLSKTFPFFTDHLAGGGIFGHFAGGAKSSGAAV